MVEFGPLGAILDEQLTLETDAAIAQATGESAFFGDNPTTAQFVGRWEYLKSKGVTGVFLWERYEKFRPLVPHYQKRGTCFPAGTLVLMADGSEKPIEHVLSGEYVISHTGEPRKVLDTGMFKYTGRIATVDVARFADATICTQEHEFLECVNDIVPVGPRVEYEGKRNRVYFRQGVSQWVSADQMRKGTRLHVIEPNFPENPLTVDLAKYCTEDVVKIHKDKTVTLDTVRKKQTHQVLPRFLEFDERTAFIVGLYAAEGSCEKNRVTFTLDALRTDLVEQIQRWVNDYLPGVNVSVVDRPPRLTAVNVRVNCPLFADLIREFVPGIAITKKPNHRILTTPKGVRRAFLNGWLAGDGCEMVKRNPVNVGVTSSVDMMRFLRNLSLSIGMNPAIAKRKQQQHQNAAAYDITFAGSEYESLHGLISGRHAGEVHERSENGWLIPVESVSLSESGSHVVFNLEVEEDHSYIVNGLAAANCVARGTHQAVQHSYYNALATGVQIGEAAEIAWEPIYGGARVYVGGGSISGDGAVGAHAAAFVSGLKGGGICRRGKYGSADLTLTNETWAVNNADRGDRFPAELMAELKQHTCRAHRVRNNTEIADSIASKFAIARCWDTLFGDRDKDGFSKPAGNGAHCQAIIGVFVMKNGQTGFVELQSWGPNTPKGPRTLRYAGGEIALPDGCYAVSEDDYLRAQQARFFEAWSFAVRTGQEFR